MASAFNVAHIVSTSVRCSTGLCGWGGQLAREAGTGCWAEQLRLAIGLCNWAAELCLGRAAVQCSKGGLAGISNWAEQLGGWADPGPTDNTFAET